MTKLIKLIILLIFFSVNTGYSSTGEIKEIDENHINFIYQRILCLANIFTQIKFTFNNKQIKIKSFKEFAKLFSEIVFQFLFLKNLVYLNLFLNQ